ncbi:MAG: M14 family metallopeptidase [Acidobacteriota bacterium]
MSATDALLRFVAATAACLALAAQPSTTLTARQDHASLVLGEIFTPGGPILKDRNGDGLTDFVDATFALGEPASACDVAAAANIAARLAFESAELNLPLPRDGARLTIAIGVVGIRRAGLTDAQAGVASLPPGEGIVRLAGPPDRPVLVVAGNSVEDTQAAADYVAGRLPFLWDAKGPRLGQVATDLRAVLANAGIAATVSDAVVVHVRHGTDGLERVTIDVSVDTPAALRRAAAALRGLRTVVQPRAAGGEAGTPRALDYPGVRAVRVRLQAPGAALREVDIPRVTEPEAASPGRRPAGAKEGLDLSNLFTNDGLLGDSDSNLIPDRTDVLLVPDGEGLDGVVDVAARVSLESAGVSLPIAVPASALDKPASHPTLVLVGVTHALVDELIKAGKFVRPDLQPGDGYIGIVRKAWGEKPAIVVTGGDLAGVRRALVQLAERVPHLWPRGKDRPTLDTVEDDVRRFLGGRSPAGQAAIGLYKLGRIGAALSDAPIERASVRLSLEKPDPGFAAFLRAEATRLLGSEAVDVMVEALDVKQAGIVDINGQPVGGVFDIPSEVEEFWHLFRTKVLPAVRRRAPVVIEARLSESRELRASIERQATRQLLEKGASPDSRVIVLSAYKQGYSWLFDVVRPALAGKPIKEVRIRFAEAGPPPDWRQQAMYIPTRWLHEIFPIDEVLARELRLDLAQIAFEKGPVGVPTYEVTATGAAGEVLWRQTFDPRFVVRPYFERFPDYERVRVATGWMEATVGGRSVVNQRIQTDSERFWDIFQVKTLPAIYDYVMLRTDGKPRPGDAPHFGELIVDVALSEPFERLGVDEEHISPMEALHEDVYFATLHFFDVMGRLARGTALDYPGHIVPIMRHAPDGTPGRASVRFTGFTAPRPMVEVRYWRQDGREGRMTLDIPKIAAERPSAVAATVRDGSEGLVRLDLRVKVDSERDERDTLVARARAERVDEQVLSAEQVASTLVSLGRMRAAGVYREALAYPGLGELHVAAGWTHEVSTGAQAVAIVAANGSAPPLPGITAYLPAGDTASTEPQVSIQWDTPISVDESYQALARMARLPEARVYKAGDSYLGREVWAMDLTSPILSSHWSQAKATTLKPSVIYSGRQHANEVSSTSHILRLAEKLLTEPAFRKKLDRVNVVVHPITNPDGADLAHALWKISPAFMMHAGYLGSLGVDVTSAQWETDPIYPESKVRAALWRAWLPDLFLNPHGYPSHEWVQPFSEYAAWVRNRVTESRDWWGMRGWFMPGFSYIDEAKYPRHKEAAFEIQRRITAAINGVPEVRALNARAYDRYRRYGFAFNQEDFKFQLTDGVLIYTAVKGGKANPRGNDPMGRQPNITIWSGVTEAPDEPAYGDWLRLVASAGLAWDTALLDYLVEGDHEVERKQDAFQGGVTLSLSRARPPKGKEQETEDRRW